MYTMVFQITCFLLTAKDKTVDSQFSSDTNIINFLEDGG